jgi:DNA-binding LacI/PurR family transcriptional regulator/DNA-binding transcriptional regulator YhcF (GntR family)
MKSCDNHFTDLLDLPLSGKMPASKEIRGKIRTLVKNGALRANSQLPSTKTLAELFGVFPNTVQLALEPLVREGLLDRRQNRGTVVRKGRRHIVRLGFYENFDAIAPGDRDFLLSLQVEMAKVLEKQNAELKVWVGSGRIPKSLPKNLLEACEKREVDGIAITQGNPSLVRALMNLPVPIVAYPGLRFGKSRVEFRHADLIDQAVRRLAALGVSRPAFLSSVTHEKQSDIRDNSYLVYEYWNKSWAALGIKAAPELLARPSTSRPVKSIEQFGYDAMKALWNRKSRPDGLFIFPHTAARGSLIALLEMGVGIPADLKLVAHGNIETPILTPYPVDWITSSSRVIVQAMVNQIQRGLDGLPVKPVFLKHKATW